MSDIPLPFYVFLLVVYLVLGHLSSLIHRFNTGKQYYGWQIQLMIIFWPIDLGAAIIQSIYDYLFTKQ